jgi:hypothetical protein
MRSIKRPASATTHLSDTVRRVPSAHSQRLFFATVPQCGQDAKERNATGFKQTKEEARGGKGAEAGQSVYGPDDNNQSIRHALGRRGHAGLRGTPGKTQAGHEDFGGDFDLYISAIGHDRCM